MYRPSSAIKYASIEIKERVANSNKNMSGLNRKSRQPWDYQEQLAEEALTKISFDAEQMRHFVKQSKFTQNKNIGNTCKYFNKAQKQESFKSNYKISST